MRLIHSASRKQPSANRACPPNDSGVVTTMMAGIAQTRIMIGNIQFRSQSGSSIIRSMRRSQSWLMNFCDHGRPSRAALLRW